MNEAKRPTIAELEAILEEKDVRVEIRPNGEVFVRNEAGESAQVKEKEFKINFSRAVAEGDEPICECSDKSCEGFSELTDDGLAYLTNIAAATAEPWFERITELETQLAEAQQRADGFQKAYEDALTGNRAILEREAALRAALEELAAVAQTLEENSSDGCLFCGHKKHGSTCLLNGALETYRQLAPDPLSEVERRAGSIDEYWRDNNAQPLGEGEREAGK